MSAALPTPRPVRAVVFDMDGTLIDSESVYRRALEEALLALGFAPEREFLHGLNGLPGPEVNARIQARFGQDFPFDAFRAAYVARRDALAAGGIGLKPGAEEALRLVAGLGLPMALATSSLRESALAHLTRLEVLAHFDAVVARDEVPRAKPHPDLFLEAAARLQVEPEDCLAVEDSHAGVQAALAARMMVVMVPDMVPPTEELRQRCLAVHGSLFELRELLR